jgi:hypothetical protein
MFDLADVIRRSWPVFYEAVLKGNTISYSELARRVGPPLHRRHLHRQLLVPLSARCRQARLPDLSALVVRQDTGRPGAGWHGPSPSADPARSWAEALAECYSHNWNARVDPRLLQD